MPEEVARRGGTYGEAGMSQPNILFVMADQMSAMAVPCYGHPVVKMPALSRLAAEGVVF